MKTGIELITDERQRQIEKEGYTSEHDLNHTDAEFVLAAIAYLSYNFEGWSVEATWPWEMEYFKPTNLKRNLVKAGALVAAAIDRLQQDEENKN